MFEDMNFHEVLQQAVDQLTSGNSQTSTMQAEFLLIRTPIGIL